MGQPAYSEKQHHKQTFAIASESCACRSLYINYLANPTEHNKLIGQGLARKSNIGSNKALFKAPTPSEAPTPSLIPLSTKNFFTRFIKMFMEMTQAQALAEPQKCSLKAKTPDTYFGISHINCYYFCQQCENYFEISGNTEMNHTPFTATFFRSIINLKQV